MKRHTGSARELDHWLWVVPDLEVGALDIRKSLGETYFGGRHQGLGSANHILPLDGRRFLEVLGPSCGESGPLGQRLRSLQPQLATFAVRVAALDDIAAQLTKLGLHPVGPASYTRVQVNGIPLRWRLLRIGGHEFGDFLPFFIDWQDSPHPSLAHAPQVSVDAFEVTHPSDRLAWMYSELALPVVVKPGSPAMTLRLRTPNGARVLEGRGESDFLAGVP